MSSPPVRLAELIGALSLATDHAAGMPEESALRTAMLAEALARKLGLDAAARSDAFYTALLRFIGCTAFAPELAAVASGEDLKFLTAFAPADGTRPKTVLKAALKLGEGRGALGRAAQVAKVLSNPKVEQELRRTHCELALGLAPSLGVSSGVVAALGFIYARFDGKGHPAKVRGEAIPLPARILHVAYRAEVQRRFEGAEAAAAALEDRAGGELDPKLVKAFVELAPAVFDAVAPESVWDAFLSAEPSPQQRVAPTQLEPIARAFATFADVKSPFTVAHSTRVAKLAVSAGAELGLGVGALERLELGALLHDLGRCAVPNGIWDKPGLLSPLERERMQRHAYHSNRVLELSPLLRPYAEIASADHERGDGSGYPRRVTAGSVSREARLLAACDVFTALGEARPHRPAMSAESAARVLQDEARAGRLDREAVEAVLKVSGHRGAAKVRGQLPAGLSDREAEVLAWVAKGLTNKQIAAQLRISAKTVQHHITHIHEKTGVSSRAAAAVFALKHGLFDE